MNAQYIQKLKLAEYNLEQAKMNENIELAKIQSNLEISKMN